MKKILFPFLPIICLTFLNKCSNNKKINTLFGINEISNRNIKIISSDNLASKFDNKETFIFVQTTTTCSCSKEFIDIVNNYIKDTGILIYYIDYNEAKNITDKYKFSIRNDSPTFHIIDHGEINYKNEILYNDNYNFFTNQNEFNNYMDKKFYKPSLFYVSLDELKNIYKQKNNFYVYFAKTDCLECKTLTNSLFYDYSKNKELKKGYIFDFADIDPEESKIIKKEFGLNEETNTKWGYKSGALPMLYYIESNSTHDYIDSIKQGFTFGNDILDENYTVTSSYFNEERIKNIEYSKNIENQIGKKYKENQIIKSGNYFTLNEETNINIYKNIFNDFMNFIQNKII